MQIPKLLSAKDKKGQAGLITGLVFGMASLMIGVIVGLIG